MSDSPTALKHFYNLALAQRIADNLHAIDSSFPHAAFMAQVAAQVDALELKDRVRLMAAALHTHLPADYPQAIGQVMQILGPENHNESDMFNFGYHILPLAQFVESYGLDHFEPSMGAIYEITKRFSSEFAVRPFIQRYPDQTLARLNIWVNDPNHHVRRLVSEGTRPRLPWAMQLKQFIQDPSPSLALLEQLKDDSSVYVQTSVGNHLNDIGKDHPDTILDLAERWAVDAPPSRLWILKRALRTLVKQGNPRALAVLGYHTDSQITLNDFSLASDQIEIGDNLTMRFTLTNTGEQTVNVAVDYVVHFMKANGTTAPKVFKLKTITLAPSQSISIEKNHPMRLISTRRYYAGQHGVELQVNGQRLGYCEFHLAL